MEILNIILPELMKLLGVLIGLLIYVVTSKIKETFKKQLENDIIKNIVDHTVKYVEQVFKDIHGKEKLDKAKEVVYKLLNEKGIQMSDSELEILIESAVNTLNEKKEV